MIKKSLVLTVLVVLLLLIGCRSSITETTQTMPTASIQPLRYLTALEAYEEIRSTMQTWHEDAFVCGIYSSGSEQSEKRVRADGRAIVWNFAVYSSGAQRLTNVTWVSGEIQVGISDAPGGEVPVSGRQSLSVEQMIDSNEVVQIAAKVLDSSGDGDEPLIEIETERYNVISRSVISPSWQLTYGNPDDIHHRWIIIVNALTGEILRNDFNPPPPTPIPIRPPVPDKLALYTYGNFDLMLTNAQGLSLGIELDSGKHIAEIPDAWQDLDPGITTEDSVRVTAAVLMNPLEGLYRLHLHGPGEQEKQCRLSVEIRKGTGEEVLREVEVPCQGGVSLVYEFTLSLSGEELLSNIVPVKE